MAPNEEDPTSGGGQEPQGDPQEGAQDTSGGVPKDGEEMAGDQTRQGEDVADAQMHQGAATSQDANMEYQAPPRGVPPLRQPPSTGNLLQTVAHIAWLARIMGPREGQVQVSPFSEMQSEGEAGFILVPSGDREPRELVEETDGPMSCAQMGEMGSLLQ